MFKKLIILSGFIFSFQVMNAHNEDLSPLVDDQVAVKKSEEPAVDAKYSTAIHFLKDYYKVVISSMAGLALGKAALTKVVWTGRDDLYFEALIRLAGSCGMFYAGSNVIKELFGPISSHFFKFGVGSGVALANLGDY